MVTYDEVDLTDLEWLWEEFIPAAGVTVIAGKAGIGKSYFMADLAARITKGGAMPDGTEMGMPAGSVMLATFEDDPDTEMGHRLKAAGADMSKVIDITEDGEFCLDEPGIASLRQAIKDRGDVRAIFIDPLGSASPIALTSDDRTVRRVIFQPLKRLCKETGVTVILIAHMTKATKATVAGANAIVAAPRMVLFVERSATNPRIRSVRRGKSNTSDDDGADIIYTVTGKRPDTHVEWTNATEEMTGDLMPTPVPRLAGPMKVLQALIEDGPNDHMALSVKTDVPDGTVRTALSRMMRDGHVTKGEGEEKYKYAATPAGKKHFQERLDGGYTTL
jgi:AAA domain